MSDSSLVTTAALWPQVARVFGLDASGKHIKRFTLCIEHPLPVVRVEFVVSAGQALDLQTLLEEYELRPRTTPAVLSQPAEQADLGIDAGVPPDHNQEGA